jgi:uncharacterized protein (DUF3084 family)
LGDVRDDLETAKTSLGEARSRVEHLRRESGGLRTEKARIQAGLNAAEASLDAATVALDAATDSLDKVEAEKAVAETRRDELSAEVEGLRQRQTSLQAKLDEIEAEWNDRRAFRAGKLAVFDLGAELVRGVVERPDSLDDLKNEIVALLVLADQQAEAGGAGLGDNDRYVRAVGPSPLDALSDDEQWAPESRVLGYFVAQLWEAGTDSHVARVIVTRRTFAGEQAYVVFVQQPNRLLFRQGETIVVRRIALGLTEADAFEQLWFLIADPTRSEVRKQAQGAGMLPDPKSGRYGEIEVRQLFRAAGQCANRDSPTTVKVQAAADVYTAGPLSIRIVVEASDGGAG